MDSDIVRRHEILKSELVRAFTFQNWPHRSGKKDLIEAGFYHPGDGTVICYSCDTQFFGFFQTDRDLPRDLHQQIVPECPFIRGHDPSIKLGYDEVPPLSIDQLREVYANPGDDLIKISPFLMKRKLSLTCYTTTRSVKQLVIPKPDIQGGTMDVNIFFSQMSLLKNRVKTFDRLHGNWFSTIPSEKLAHNGLFALEWSMAVQCCSSRYIICPKDSMESSNILKHHAEISPNCPFLNDMKEILPPRNELKNTMCNICLQDRYVSCAAYPCGHLYCDPCFDSNYGLRGRKCGFCKLKIKKKMRVYN